MGLLCCITTLRLRSTTFPTSRLENIEKVIGSVLDEDPLDCRVGETGENDIVDIT